MCIILCSGGKDSLALVQVLAEIYRFKKSIVSFYPVVVHFNHNTRISENSIEEEFVVDTALKLGLDVHVVSLKETDFKKPKSENQQKAWSNWRYQEAHRLGEAFRQLYGTEHYLVVTAHHAMDHVETIIHNILRGCGSAGIVGLHQFEKGIWRPFSEVTQEEILFYLSQKSLTWKEDSSNSSDDYTRNWIRNEILPKIKQLAPDFQQKFLGLSFRLNQEITMLKQIAGQSLAAEDKNLENCQSSIHSNDEPISESRILFLAKSSNSKDLLSYLSHNQLRNLCSHLKQSLKNHKKYEIFLGPGWKVWIERGRIRFLN